MDVSLCIEVPLLLSVIRTVTVSNLYSVVAVFRGEDESGKVTRQVQTAEIPHQVPEDDGMLAQELVGVDHLIAHIKVLEDYIKQTGIFSCTGICSKLNNTAHLV